MRGRHRGSVYQNTRGQWVAEVTLNGKRYTRKGRTADAVNAKLARILHDFHEGVLIADDKTRVAGYLLDWVKKIDVRPTTRQDYSTVITKHINPHVGTKKLNVLGPRDVENVMAEAKKYKVSEKKIGLSNRRVAYIRTVLKMALSAAHRWELVRRNVAAMVKAPPKKAPKVQCFNEEQFHEFVTAIRGQRYESLFLIAVTLGPRKGELLGLRWDDIDGSTLRVRRTLQRFGGSLVEFKPKTDSSSRDILIPVSVLAVLRTWRVTRQEECLAAGIPWDVHGYVYSIDARNLSRLFERILEKAKLPVIRFHDLRHTAATMMLLRGVPVKTVAQILGHSSIVTTLQTYAHVLDSQRADAAKIMDELIWDAK